MEHGNALLFIEMGLVLVGLALLARAAHHVGFSAIPLYLTAGLFFGEGGIAPLPMSANFLHVGAEIGVLLLLFMMGLEYTGEELRTNLQKGAANGVVDFVLNFPPGFVAGVLLGWPLLGSVLLGGVTFISSSGVVARLLGELKQMAEPQTPVIISILVLEDLVMALYLPMMAVLVSGGAPARVAAEVGIALGAVSFVLFLAIRYGRGISNWAIHASDEVVLLTALGLVLLVAGLAERVQVSAAIGAFLVGIAFSGPMAEVSHRLFSPLRDLFAAVFFFLIGLEIDPATLTGSLPVAAALALASGASKVATGFWATHRLGLPRMAGWRAGLALLARGEFSVVIAGLGEKVEPELLPLTAAYVLITAIAGPAAARLIRAPGQTS